MKILRRSVPWAVLLVACAALSHDDQVGARFVQTDGVNVTDCLDHDLPCASIQYALSQAEPGNTVKVAAGIYDMSGADPESFLFGAIKAAGGYSATDHFHESEPDANATILVGVDARYRQAMAKQGFKWAANYTDAANGLVDDSVAAALQASQAAAASCVQGLAGQFPCRNVDFQAQIALNQFSTLPASASNLWGFVDLNDQREYVLVGLRNGTAVVDVTDPASPREVATVNGNASPWREVKIYQHFDTEANRYRAYAYISTEAANSGLQVIDLSGLPDSVSLATTLVDTGRQHTLYISNIDYATNMALPGQQAYLYVAGANVNSGAWRVYSLANPAQPELLATASAGSQYMHDSTGLYLTDSRTAQCAPGHDPCEVLVDFNENTVDLWDVTDKHNAVLLSSTTYPSMRYTHSGWPSVDQRYLFFHDELEEIQRGFNTQIYTMNLDNLRAPTIATSYQGTGTATDHNGYTKGGFYYVSHYRRGLVIFDVSNPLALKEVGSFDTFLAPDANTAGTDGAWGVYPFLPSGTVAISDVSNGLFLLKDNTATLPQNAGNLGFVSTTVSATESAGSVSVRLQRTGGFAGAVSIQYATADGSAIAGSDYTAASGVLNWPASDMDERSLSIPLSNDAQIEDAETIRLTLSNPTGGAVIEGAATIDVTITDDDTGSSGGGNSSNSGGGAMQLIWMLMLGSLAAAQARRPICRSGFNPTSSESE